MVNFYKMTTQKDHTFIIKSPPTYNPAIISVEIHPEASLIEVMDAFEKFLISVGYILPEGTKLGFEYDPPQANHI